MVNITGNDFLPLGVSNSSLLTADDIIVTIDTAQWHMVWYQYTQQYTDHVS